MCVVPGPWDGICRLRSGSYTTDEDGGRKGEILHTTRSRRSQQARTKLHYPIILPPIPYLNPAIDDQLSNSNGDEAVVRTRSNGTQETRDTPSTTSRISPPAPASHLHPREDPKSSF